VSLDKIEGGIRLPQHDNICNQFTSILGGEHEFRDGVCSVTIKRNTKATILGRPTSGGTVNTIVTFESLDDKGDALNLGEIALRQNEVFPFVSALQQQGILVSAIHNHWIFINPILIYVHFSSVENPLTFAQKIKYALQHINH
jgi:hypothetical protein